MYPPKKDPKKPLIEQQWKAHQMPSHWFIFSDSDERTIAKTRSVDTSSRTARLRGERYAMLIAAAPDLLAACSATLAMFESDKEAPDFNAVLDGLRKALVKATRIPSQSR
jgi:hypothetical protein